MKKYQRNELCLIWIDSFSGLEYKHKSNIMEHVIDAYTISDFLIKSKDYIVESVGGKNYEQLLSSASKTYLEYILKELDEKGVEAITYFSPDYPESLKNITCPPLVLYVLGNKELLSGKNFSIVGSRKSLPLSIKLAENYTKALVEADFNVVTGIAEGVDSAVLKSALSCNGKAISVIAGGFDHIYPSGNNDLIKKVIENGLAVSEYPPQTIPKPYYFPVRNRIIAGLGKGTLVVSGGLKSGTMYTAEYAEEFNRDLFAIPYSVGVAGGQGCNDLIKRGAILTDSPDDILEFYGENIKKSNAIELSEREKLIVKALKDGQVHIENIVNKTNIPINELMTNLSIMEIKGIVIKNGNFYGLAVNIMEE